MTRKALGRGLSALIPEPEPTTEGEMGNYLMAAVEHIKPQKSQPRTSFDDRQIEELGKSLRRDGVIQPLIVRKKTDGWLEIIAGERRWRAAQRVGITEIPVLIREANDLEAYELALVENLRREDLNPIEEAEAYSRLLAEHQYTQEKLSNRLDIDRSTIANALRLLTLPQAAKTALAAGAISSGHARALVPLKNPKQILDALAKIVRGGLSVRQTEEMVRSLRTASSKADTPSQGSPNARHLQEELSRLLLAKVRLRGNEKKGHIAVYYESVEELDRLLDRLAGPTARRGHEVENGQSATDERDSRHKK